MSAKALDINQCFYLHQYFPPSECCLCKAREEIESLKEQVRLLEAKLLMANEDQDNQNL